VDDVAWRNSEIQLLCFSSNNIKARREVTVM
jgi:hypothetical protein